jgi:hypothetical protein
MPRYYFHVRRGQSTILDHAGIVLADTAHAEADAAYKTHGPTGQSLHNWPRRTGGRQAGWYRRQTTRLGAQAGTRNNITAEIKELAHEYGPMAIKELEMMDVQKIARALAAITLAIAGVLGLLGGGALEFAIGLFLIGNALLLLGTLVWT